MSQIHLPQTSGAAGRQDALELLVSQANAIVIPPVQAIYDVRQLENLFEQTTGLAERSLLLLNPIQKNPAVGADALGDFFASAPGTPPVINAHVQTEAELLAAEQIRCISQALQAHDIHSDPPSIITQCARVKGSIIKACVNVERAHFPEDELRLANQLDAQRSLGVRAAYAQCRWTLQGSTPSRRHASDLERAARALEALRQNDVFASMYFRDRLMVIALTKRIVEWLNTSSQEEIERRALEKDLAVFVVKMKNINRRQELIEHDIALVQAARKLWQDQQASDMNAQDWEMLQPLWGLDEDMDAHLRQRPTLRIDVINQHLTRLVPKA